MKPVLKQTNFGWIKSLTRAFPRAEIFLVGGAVRDRLLGRETKDYDFVVRNVPAKKLETFLKHHGRVDLVGRTFGVFKFVPTSYPSRLGRTETDKPKALSSFEPFDIALPRTEHALHHTGGYKDFKVQSDPRMPIGDDLSRRDFTINAIALNLATGELIDPFNGVKDIQKKIIRTVGKPDQRFREDYSRMLRAVRFAAQLGFTIEPKTKFAIKKLSPHLNDAKKGIWIVPRETIGRELTKAFVADPVKAFNLMDELGLIKILMPELLKMKKCPQPKNWHSEGNVWQHTRLALEILAKKYPARNALLTFAVLFHDVAKPVCLRTPKQHKTNRIRFDGHDKEGGRMARAIAERLALSSLPADTKYHVATDHLGWLVDHHLLLVNDPRKFKNQTLEKYFFNPNAPGEELLALTYCDVAAAIHADTHKPNFTNYRRLMHRIETLKKLGTKKKIQLPSPLLSGHDVMRVLKITPGPRVGDILGKIREAQLARKLKTKTDATTFLKKKYT